MAIEVYLERGEKRVFAVAVKWPGWARSGRGDDEALETLADYAERYARVAKRASIAFRAPGSVEQLTVVERHAGGGGTDFGVPGVTPRADRERLTSRDLTRLTKLLEASWATFDAAARKHSDATLRKGPRGGGRDLPMIQHHVLEAEEAYLHELGSRDKVSGKAVDDRMRAVRHAAVELLAARSRGEAPEPGPRRKSPFWTPRYFVRRSAWHALDHAWEIEDRAIRE